MLFIVFIHVREVDIAVRIKLKNNYCIQSSGHGKKFEFFIISYKDKKFKNYI